MSSETDWNKSMLWQHRSYRLAANYVAAAMAPLEAVKKIVLFGSVAVPLEKEIPRLGRFRHARQPIFHKCKDVDLAVWVSDLSNLKSLQMARAKALAALLKEHDVGVAHHQVDVFLFFAETNAHLGRLCNFGECPKGRRECLVPHCGAEKFLRQFEGFAMYPDALSPAKTVTLFERGVSTPL